MTLHPSLLCDNFGGSAVEIDVLQAAQQEPLSVRTAGRQEPASHIPARDSCQQLRQRHQLAQMIPSQQRHLEVIPRLHRGANVELGLRQKIERPEQIFARETLRQRFQAIAIAFRSDLRIVDTRRIDGEHQQVPNDAVSSRTTDRRS